MRRTTVALMIVATVLGAAGCGSTQAESDPSTSAAQATPVPTASADDSSSPPCRLKYSRDVIVWTDPGDGTDPSAVLLGDVNGATCRYTLDELPDTSPQIEQFCTVGAYASDNPGYDADAADPPKPRKVQVATGPGC